MDRQILIFRPRLRFMQRGKNSIRISLLAPQGLHCKHIDKSVLILFFFYFTDQISSAWNPLTYPLYEKR